jgi:hypothetical protein
VKGKPLLGLVGLFMPPISLVGSVRLASPTSLWARWRYDPEGKKMARAQARWQRIAARRLRAANAIAGAPTVAALTATELTTMPATDHTVSVLTATELTTMPLAEDHTDPSVNG